MTAEYSGSPLEKKLGIKPGFKILLMNPPPYYFELFNQLPPIELIEQVEQNQAELDFVHMFCTEFPQLEEYYSSIIGQLSKDGMLWISWPKKSSLITSELDRDSIRSYVLNEGLVDTKVCAVDKDWSGLKFMYRTKDR